MAQISIFDGANEFKIDKPIRLIELFAGYGSQNLALKYLGADFESWHICEWAVKSIQAYKDLHFADDNTDYSETLSFDDVVNYLLEKGISADYNKPMTIEQIKRMGESKCRKVYNNIQATHNLVSVTQTTANDLNIIDTDKYCYVMTYSFPCQDLSKAGKGKGMAKDSGTRSGLLWEVKRILDECNGNLPQVLVMENVPDVIGTKNVQHFAKWLEHLESLGYKCFWKVLNGKNYGIPQNRDRCFMVSVLGDYFFEFPDSIPLELRLKDMLETNVDEKYYLSEKMLDFFEYNTKKQKENGNGFEFKPTDGNCVAKAITTRAGQRMHDNFINCELVAILQGGKWDKTIESQRRVYGVNGVAPTLTTQSGGNQYCKIAEPKIITYDIPQLVNVRKYDVDIEKLKNVLRETKRKNKISNKDISEELKQPITKVEHWFRNDDSFSVPDADVWIDLKKFLCIDTNEFDKSIMTFEQRDGVYEKSNRVYDINGISATITSTDRGLSIYEQIKVRVANEKGYDEAFEGDTINLEQPNSKTRRGRVGHQCSQTIMTKCHQAVVEPKKRIRKLTPKECFRLMGVKDEDFEKVQPNQSESSLYHLAGDSIITNVLMAIFKEMF